MSKKTQELKEKQKFEKHIKIKKYFLRIICYTILLIVAYFTYANFFSTSAKVANTCINTKDEVKAAVKELPEVKRFLNSMKTDYNKVYFRVDVNFAHKNETRFGYAYVGKQTDNNSIYIKYKYLFSTGCNFQFQKEPNSLSKNETFIFFTYYNKMAQIDFIDQTQICNKTLSKISRTDFDKDGQPEILYGCFKGGNSNNVEYHLYKNNERRITQIDNFKSSGMIEKIADLNNDQFPDVTNPGYLIDEGTCQGDQCFAPHKPGEIKTLLKRSYLRIWDPQTGKFNTPQKGEIYYNKNFKRYKLKGS